MKKYRLLFTIAIFLLANFYSSVFAQNSSAAAANRKTALRCLSLSESYMLNNDWKNALVQAETGLSYDSNVSDLLYIKAAAQSNLGYNKADVLAVIKEAFRCDNWVNYSRNSARILYADMLCDTGLYDESLAQLDAEPLLYSADSEFIRIKNYYRLGTADSIKQARARLNSSRKIYPKDQRFPKLFFMFESAFMNYAERSGYPYEIPELVKTIAASYISEIPDYSNADVETELMALLFCTGQQQARLIKAVGEKNQNHPLFAYAGLKTGVLSEEKAYNLFFDSSDGVYSLGLLENFAALITDPALCENLSDRLKSLEGTVYIDNDLDLFNELTVKYIRGRAESIIYDSNNDGILEMNCSCDFGSPVNIVFSGSKYNLVYESFPYVSRITDNSNGNTFQFLTSSFSYNPFEMICDDAFGRFNVEFFIPQINTEIDFPDEYVLANNASSLELATKEREGSRVIYTVFEGRPVFAVFMNGGVRYAYAVIESGCPFVRYVDYDNDETYETSETYDLDYENKYTAAEDVALIKQIFGDNTFSEKLYLKKVEVDRNSDTFKEFSEQYLGNNGKISSWDSDGNGIIDYQYIRYPDTSDGVLREETILYNSNGIEFICLGNENGIPVSLKYDGKEMAVPAGYNADYYWIGEKGTSVQEQTILDSVKNGITDGAVQLVKFDDELRLSVIKIGNAFFCRKLPPSEIIPDGEADE